MKNVDKNGKIMDRVRLSGSMRRGSFGLLLGLFFLLSAANSFAQSSNRWLFVFNTSAAMRDRTNGMQAVAQDLLTTAMHGTLRPGDTIGIWTYNSELHADEAPLQNWSPNTAPGIAYNTVLFLRQHRYEKSAAFGDVMANMLRVIKMSDVITVVLVSDGSDAVKGTPFDDRIAAFYKTNYGPQKKAHMPIVTVFRGEKGILTTNTLALGQWPAEIPTVPPPVMKSVARQPAPVAPAPAKPVPSLVIIGKKAETTFNVPTDLPDHSGEPPEQFPVAPPPVETTPPVNKTETPAVAAPEPAAALKVEEKPKPAAPVAAATAPATTSTPAPAAVEPARPVQPAESPLATTSDSKEPSAAKTTAPPVEAVAPAPQKEPFSARNIGIVSVVFTLLVSTLLILSARNARRAARASLITRSLDRERE